jgi:hypothetical protein
MVIAIISNSNLFAVTRTWNGFVSSTWTNPFNWSGFTLPVAGDDVIINSGSNNNPTVGSNTPALLSITINGGSLSGNSDITATTITVNGGTFTRGTGNLTATTINLSGGTINLSNRTLSNLTYRSGTLTITNGATVTTFNIAAGSYTHGSVDLNTTTLNVNGGTFTRGSGALTATTINLDGGTIDLSNRTLSNLTYKSGTLTTTNGATVTTFNMASNSYTNGSTNLNITTLNVNGGTFTRGSGTLTLTNLTLNGGSYVNGSSNLSLSGNFTQQSGTFTHGAYNITITSNFILNGGTFNSGSGTISANDFDINNGTFNIKGNKITLGTDFTIDGGTVSVSDANLNIDDNLFLISGTLDLNNFNLTVVDDYTFRGGSITDAGSLITAANVIWNFTGFTHTLPTNLYVTGSMTFTSGVVVTSNSALVRFDYNATVASVSNTSHINGPVRKEISSSNTTPTFNFPIGNGNVYAPIEISSYGNRRNEDFFTAQYFSSRNTNAGKTKANTLNLVSQAEYWILDRAATSGTATTTAAVKLSYNTGRSGSITNASLLRVAKWNGTQWVDEGRTSGSSTNNTSGTTTSSANVTSFSPFTFGSTTSVNPLPVHLLNFTAVPAASNVDVKWTTTSEINNDFFNVEKSLDGKNWSVIGQVKGAGNTEALTNYNFLDANPVMGMQYYRLQQNDINGDFTYSSIAPVNFSASVTSTLNIYPIPANNFLNVELPGASEMLVTIYNANGQKVFEATSGSLLNIDIQNFNAGLYIVEVKADNNVSTAKFLKD